MRSNLVNAWLGPLRNRWLALLTVAVLTLGPAVAATSLVEVLENRGGAIINGSLVSNHELTLWTQTVLSATSGPAQVRVSIPLLVALAWFTGLGTALRVLAGRSVRTAWRRVPPDRLAQWLGLSALLAVLALLGLPASVAVAGHLGGPLGWLTAALWTYGLARLALALPAMLVDGLHLAGALRHAVVARRGHAATGALILLTVVSPAVVLAGLDPAIMPTARTWVGDVLWSAVVPLLEYLTLLVALPLQGVGLLRAYRVAYPDGPMPASSPDAPEPLGDPGSSRTGGHEPSGSAGFPTDERELTVTVHELGRPLATAYGPARWPSPTQGWVTDVMTPGRRKPEARTGDERPARTRPALRRLQVGAIALLSVGPAAVGPTLMLINPHGLPVATVAHPAAGFSSRSLVLAVLNDGAVVSVGPTRAALCRDAHCTDLDLLRMPCLGGATPAPEGAETRGCRTEGPVVSADVTPDGTVLALVHDRNQDVRLFWCRLEPTDDGQCRWGGAITLYEHPDQWWDRSMSVTALPGGGFAAVIISPGVDETRSTVRLITCERLDCPQPTVHVVTGPQPVGVGGLVDVSADPGSGTLAVGYVGRSDEMLYLGGCPAGCPDGPAVTRIGQWPELTPGAAVPDHPTLQVLATATGPAAVLGAMDAHQPARPAADAAPGAWREFLVSPTVVVTCGDPGCITPQRSLRVFGTGAMTLVANRAGQAYVVGSVLDHVLIGPLRAEGYGEWSFALGTVVTAAIGPDGRLRLLLSADQRPALVTLAHVCCSAQR